MEILDLLTSNYILIAAILGWASAQLIKTIIDFAFNKELNVERLIGAGGMPSSHSSTVCSLCTACGIYCGLNSAEFAITFMLAFIVMHDAMGVRRETGKQAEFLNQISALFEDMEGYPTIDGKLKVLVGHTPLQVVMGGILGVVMAIITAFLYSLI